MYSPNQIGENDAVYKWLLLTSYRAVILSPELKEKKQPYAGRIVIKVTRQVKSHLRPLY
jgi:hypothetical protein